MKKTLCALALGAFAAAGLGIATASAINSFEVRADDPTPVEHADLYINECVYSGGEGAGWNSSTNQATVPGGGCGFEYGVPTNAKTKATFTIGSGASWANWIYVRMRATDADVSPTNGFTNAGYCLEWRGNGEFNFTKNGANKGYVYVSGLAYQNNGGSFSVEFSTIDYSDGSVHVDITINETPVFNYVDDADPILSGTVYAVSGDGPSVSVTGTDLTLPSLKSLSAPTAHNAAAIVYEEVSFAGGSGGASYHYEARGSQGVSFPFRIDSAGGSGGMAFGAKADVMGGNTPCYYLSFEQWGSFTLRKGKTESPYYTDLASGAGVPLSPEAKYESTIGFRMTDFGGGDTCVTVWLGGSIIYNYWDKKTETNTPIACNPINAEGEDALTYVNLWTDWMSWTVVDPDKKAVDSFVATYIADAAAEDYTKTAEEDREATCRSKYNTAMAAFNDDEVLTATQRNLFNTGATYADARAALEYWDTHSAKSTPVRTLGGLSDGSKTTALIVATSIGILVTAFGCAFLLKKKKEN